MSNKMSNSKIGNSEKGVTLLIAILVMSGLALISLSVAAFTIQEIRASRAVAITEPAIAAAETVGEQSLWAIKRGATLATCPSQTSASLGNGALANACQSFGAATFNVSSNTSPFYLYDPNDMAGDIDLLNYPYTWLSINQTSGSFQVLINVVRLDGTLVSDTTVSPGNTTTINIPAVSPGSEGRMKVTLSSSSPAGVTVNTNQGMPSFATINAGGCASKGVVVDCNNASQELFSRRINITVPQ
jgi:hypothetical protein